MKKLSELKISPAPWRKAVNNFGMGENIIWDARAKRVAYSGIDSCFSFENQTANHNMMVAAPDMYAALWDLLFGDNGTANCRKCKGAELGNCKTCHLGKARFALEKAAGEDIAK